MLLQGYVVIPSWELKFIRAQQHLSEFIWMLGPRGDRRGYPVSKGVEANGQSWDCVWRVLVSAVDNPALPVVAGDVMFNIRSALDHLAMALVVPERRTPRVVHATQFPIFTCDVDERDPLTGRYMHGRDRGWWDKMTQGITQQAVAALKGEQPYIRGRDNAEDPRDHGLALLSEFQNADKCRPPRSMCTKATRSLSTFS